MTERAQINQLMQVGVEATSAQGTPVATTRTLPSLQISPGIKTDVKTYKGSGFKYATIAAQNKEWVEAGISGPITYDELPYLFCGIFKSVTPTGATATKVWTWEPATTSEDVVQTYTIEQGGGGRAHSWSHSLINELTLSFSRDGAEVSGSLIGASFLDGITMTAAAQTATPMHVMLPTTVSVKFASAQASLTGASALTRLISAEWSIKDRFAPVWVINGDTDWTAHIETEPTLEVKFMVEADAAGMALLTNLRAGTTHWARIAATSAEMITGSDPYTLQIDQPFKVSEVAEFSDEDGIFAIQWTGVGVYDTTWAKVCQVVVNCGLATLA